MRYASPVRREGQSLLCPYPYRCKERPRPPMVCVKLPRSVLVGFHLFRATKLPKFQGLKVVNSGLITLPCVSSWCSVVRFVLDKAASYRRISVY